MPDKTDRALMFDNAYKRSTKRRSSSPSQGYAVAMRSQYETRKRKRGGKRA